MADTPAPSSSRKGFNIGNPGMKEYLIVGGLALALGVWYLRRKQAAAAAAQQQSSSTGQPIVLQAAGGGIPFGALFAALQNHQSSPVTINKTINTDTDQGNKDRDKDGRGKGKAPTVVSPWRGPNLDGLTVPQAKAALAGYQKGKYTVVNITRGGQDISQADAGTDTIVSFTPYSNGNVRVGMM